jgi:microcystin-dependent protein
VGTVETNTPPPTGWLLCDGLPISSATYPALFQVIGTRFGGDAANFDLPDLRGRVIAGKDDMGGMAAGRLSAASGMIGTDLGAAGGEETHLLSEGEMPSHTHGVTDNGHSHPPTGNGDFWGFHNGNGCGLVCSNPAQPQGSSPTTGVATANISIQAAGGGAAHNNVQPTIVLNYLIKY